MVGRGGYIEPPCLAKSLEPNFDFESRQNTGKMETYLVEWRGICQIVNMYVATSQLALALYYH